MSAPSSRIWPEVGASRPASRPSSVLFPLPEAPMMATNWPRCTSKSMPLRISTVWVAVSIRLVTWRAMMAALVNWFDIVPRYLLWHFRARLADWWCDRGPCRGFGVRRHSYIRRLLVVCGYTFRGRGRGPGPDLLGLGC